MQPRRADARGLRRGAGLRPLPVLPGAAPLIAARRLRVVLADYEVEPWPVSLTYPSVRLLPSRTKVFIEWMKEELRAAV